jgi:DNA-binding transcriptional MerR regulator
MEDVKMPGHREKLGEVTYLNSMILEFCEKYWFEGRYGWLTNMFNEKTHKFDNSQASYRLINYWEKAGLLDDQRPEGKGWRKYSMMDVLWIETLSQLRMFGYPLEKLNTLKQNLKKIQIEGWGNEMPVLEVYFIQAYIYCDLVDLLVMADGTFCLTTSAEYLTLLQKGVLATTSHLKVNLNSVATAVTRKDCTPRYIEGKLAKITEEEVQVLKVIRTESFQQITLNKKNGKVVFATGTEDISVKAKIEDLVRQGDYQSIEIQMEGGKKVSIKRKTKMKL